MKYINKAWTVYTIAYVKVIDDNSTSTDYKQVCIVTIFNVTKAFDEVDTISSYNVSLSRRCINWFASYLNNHEQ